LQVKVDQPRLELQLDVLRDSLGYMHKQGVSTEKMEKEMKETVENFGAVKKQTPLAQEVIKPVQQREAEKIRAEVEKFTMKIKGYQRDLAEKSLMKAETGVDRAYAVAGEVKTELRRLDAELAGLVGFATVFEFLEITDGAKSVAKTLHGDLGVMVQLWHFIAMVEFQMGVWNQTKWDEINIETMEDGTKALFKQLRAQDKVAKSTDAFIKLEAKVCTQHTPLIPGLLQSVPSGHCLHPTCAQPVICAQPNTRGCSVALY
jgi:hypothetical protein